MRRAAAEGIRYLEIQTGPFGYQGNDRVIEPDRMADLYRETLQSPAARATGVEVRFLINVLRTAPDVGARLRQSVEFATQHNDTWVGVHLSGMESKASEDLRKLRSVYWELHRDHPMIGMAVHAGEGWALRRGVELALDLPITRIGHGLSAAANPSILDALSAKGITIESSITSNYMFAHMSGFDEHPLPQFGAAGVGVCLNTDNPGVAGTILTDEYYCAVKYLNMRWADLVYFTTTSLVASFAPFKLKVYLVDQHIRRLRRFAEQLHEHSVEFMGSTVEMSPFAIRELDVRRSVK